MVKNNRGRGCKVLRLDCSRVEGTSRKVLNGWSRRIMRSKRSLEPFMKGLVGQRKALEFILSDMGSSWRVMILLGKT